MPTEPAQNPEEKPSEDQAPTECDSKTESSPSKAGKPTREGPTIKEQDSILKLELELVQERLRHRDGEINILLRSLKQERKRASRAEGALSAAGVPIRAVSPVSPDRVSPVRLSRNKLLQQSSQVSGETNAVSSHPSQGDSCGGHGVGMASVGEASVDEVVSGSQERGQMEAKLSQSSGSKRTQDGSEEWRATLKEGKRR